MIRRWPHQELGSLHQTWLKEIIINMGAGKMVWCAGSGTRPGCGRTWFL